MVTAQAEQYVKMPRTLRHMMNHTALLLSLLRHVARPLPVRLAHRLIPMYEDDWMEPGVRETLMPGDQVVAKVYKIRTPGLYRWPIQLEMLEPAHIAENLMRPELYQAPINHDWALENEMDMEDIVEATGRDYKPTNYLIPQDDAERARDVQQVGGAACEGHGDAGEAWLCRGCAARVRDSNVLEQLYQCQRWQQQLGSGSMSVSQGLGSPSSVLSCQVAEEVFILKPEAVG